MEIPLNLRSVAFDSQPYPANGVRSLSFFQPTDNNQEPSAADITEEKIVEWLANHQDSKHLLLETLGLPRLASVAPHVRAPFIESQNHKPGDIDLILCGCGAPRQAVVIEWKRVKVRHARDLERVNKINGIADAVAQLKGLLRMGFSRTFLGVVVVVDGRQQGNENTLFRGASNGTYCRVIDAGGIDLPEEAGLIYAEIVQTRDCSIDDAGMISMALAKQAVPREQPGDLSGKIVRYFSNRASK